MSCECKGTCDCWRPDKLMNAETSWNLWTLRFYELSNAREFVNSWSNLKLMNLENLNFRMLRTYRKWEPLIELLILRNTLLVNLVREATELLKLMNTYLLNFRTLRTFSIWELLIKLAELVNVDRPLNLWTLYFDIWSLWNLIPIKFMKSLRKNVKLVELVMPAEM